MLRNSTGEIVTLVGIAGKAGAGKDTLANALDEYAKFSVASFAFPLKAGLAMMFDFGIDRWDDRDWKEAPLEGLGISPRRLAQTLGTEWGRMLDPGLWVRAMERQIESYSDTRVVIPDVRFENEAAFVREHGTLVHVQRSAATLDGEAAAHASEAGVAHADGDLFVYNDGTLEEYTSKCIGIAVRGLHEDNITFDISRWWNKSTPKEPDDCNWAEPLIIAQKELERFYSDLINGRSERAVDRFNVVRTCIDRVARIATLHGFDVGYLNVKLGG
jgi:hypothetical protein